VLIRKETRGQGGSEIYRGGNSEELATGAWRGKKVFSWEKLTKSSTNDWE